MRFGEAGILWGLLALPLLVAFLVIAERKRRRDLARWFDPSLWARLASEASPSRRRASAILLVAALALLLLGAARPQLGSRILETRQRGSDVVIAVDVSLSMEARDVLPSRRERSRQEILTLLDRLRGDRIGLVTFANAAFIQCPLTLDRGAIRTLLPLLDPTSIPEPGTNLAEAIHRAVGTFQEDPRRGRAIILLTDGEAHEGDIEKAVAEAKDARARICAIGIGNTQGEPIPIPGRPGEPSSYKKDRQGQVVLTRLEEDPLKRLCSGTGGIYVRADAGMAGARVVQSLRDLEQGEMEGGLGIRYEERFSYFAAIALGILLVEGALGTRRRRR
jgi:Ca-activated chloride channel homolog